MLAFGLQSPLFARLRVVGGGYREKALCPVCFSTDRERLLFLFLRESTAVFTKRTRLLHFAPEDHLRGILAKAPGVSYWTGDLAAPAVSVRLDITRLPFLPASFDAIVCSHVLEHVSDDATAMQEMFAVLRPGGQAVIQVPIALGLSRTYEDPSVRAQQDREREFGQSDHVRLFALDVIERLRLVGFRVEAHYLARERGSRWADRFRVNPDEPLFLCKKPESDGRPVS
jgi:SAM-dependent methyltransferase